MAERAKLTSSLQEERVNKEGARYRGVKRARDLGSYRSGGFTHPS